MRRVLALATLAVLTPAAAKAQCSITVKPVSFGTYLPISSVPADSTGTVTIGCHLFFGPYAVALNQGLFGRGNFDNRRMNAGSAYLSYQLYTNAARTLIWGDGIEGSQIAFGVCTGVCSASYTIYGRIPAHQTVSPGSYADTLTVTVVF